MNAKQCSCADMNSPYKQNCWTNYKLALYINHYSDDGTSSNEGNMSSVFFQCILVPWAGGLKMVSGLILSQTNIYIYIPGHLRSFAISHSFVMSVKNIYCIGLAMPNNSSFVMSDICSFVMSDICIALSYQTYALLCHVRHALLCHVRHAQLCHVRHALLCHVRHALLCHVTHARLCHLWHDKRWLGSVAVYEICNISCKISTIITDLPFQTISALSRQTVLAFLSRQTVVIYRQKWERNSHKRALGGRPIK